MDIQARRREQEDRTALRILLNEEDYTALRALAEQLGLNPSWRSIAQAITGHSFKLRAQRGPELAPEATIPDKINIRVSQARRLQQLASEFQTLNSRRKPSPSALLHAIAVGDLVLEVDEELAALRAEIHDHFAEPRPARYLIKRAD